MVKKGKWVLIPIMIGLVFVLAVVQGLGRVRAEEESTLGRELDPVVVAGAAFPELIGQPLDELKLYARDGSGWSPIPFQFDERLNNITGTYVISEDGLLDANDELVFMAGDAASLAAGDDWVNDDEARSHARHQITATNPLSPAEAGWVYLYRSTTLSNSTASYVSWDQALQTMTTISYTGSFTSNFVGLSDLFLASSGLDILDRQKIRVKPLILPALNEEDLTAFVTPIITIPVVGPVRGVANGSAFNVSIYGARLSISVTLDASDFPLSIDWLRTSLDLNDPAVTGINSYFDSNGTAVPIDGSPDSVPSSPPLSWYQASGPGGGMVVVVPAIGGGTVSNYYEDNSGGVPGDTGDLKSYGDTGFRIDSPGGLVQLALVAHILPPGSTSSVGASYAARVANPLQAAAAAQYFHRIYQPLVLSP